MLQFIHIFRLTHKNIVQYHSYFRGHLQNQLLARGHLRLHLRLCVCGLEFPVTETIRPTSLFCFGFFFFILFSCWVFAMVTWQPYDPTGGQLIMLCVSIKLLNNSTLKIACDTLKKKCSEKEEWGSTNRCKDTHRQLLSRGFCLMTVQVFFSYLALFQFRRFSKNFSKPQKNTTSFIFYKPLQHDRSMTLTGHR